MVGKKKKRKPLLNGLNVNLYDCFRYGVISVVSHVIGLFLYSMTAGVLMRIMPTSLTIGRLVMNPANLIALFIFYPVQTVVISGFLSCHMIEDMYSPSEDKYFRIKNVSIMVGLGEITRFILCVVPIPMLEFGQLLNMPAYMLFILRLNFAGRLAEMQEGFGYRISDYFVYALIHLLLLLPYIPLATLPSLIPWRKCEHERAELLKYRTHDRDDSVSD